MTSKRPLPGDIGFSRSPGFVQRCIQLFTFSKVTHTLLFCEAFGQTAVFEAGSRQVQVVPYSKNYLLEKNTAHRVWRPTKATEQEKQAALVLSFALYAGEKYGSFQLLWFTLRFAWSLYFPKRKTPIANRLSSGVICSELVWYYLNSLGGEYRALAESVGLPNEVNAADIENAILDHQHLFDFVLEYEVPA